MKNFKTPFKSLFIIPVVLLIAVSSCKDKTVGPIDSEKTVYHNMTLNFTPKFKDQPLEFNKVKYISNSGDTFSVSNYKVLLSNFIFQKEDGSFLNIKNAYGYLSFANGIKSVKVEGIPAGKYKSIAFEVGLDSAINHGDFAQWPATHPLNPVLTGMHWEWKTGYIFHIFEGGFMDNGKVSSFSFHVAQDKNVYKYVFVNDFTVASNVTAEFNAQADSYFSSFINLSLKTDGSFSHSDDVDPLMMKFRGNMQDAFDLVSVK